MLPPQPPRNHILAILLLCFLAGTAHPALAQDADSTPIADSSVEPAERLSTTFLPFVVAVGSGPEPLAATERAFPPDATSRSVHLPLIANRYQPIQRHIDAIPVAGAPLDRPAAINGDVNLALRGYTGADEERSLINIGGPTDVDPPQLATLFSPARAATIEATWRVHEWNWSCGRDGCRGNPIAAPPVTLISLSAGLGEKIYLPTRNAQIYDGGYKALVLYADERRITLTYTRDDSPVYGYMVQLEDVGVDPALVQRYRELNAAGRNELPALRSGELIGYAYGGSVKVAVRDTGSFMDPRTRKDWWKGW